MGEKNKSSMAEPKLDSYRHKLEKLETVSGRTLGQIAFIDRLVVAIPDGLNWDRVLNENGEVIKYHYRGLPDEDLIKIVIYGQDAEALLNIDLEWYASQINDGANQANRPDHEKAKLMHEHTGAILGTLKDYSYEELKEEFDSRRRDEFLRHCSRLDFEKKINQIALSYSGDLDETFERIGYSPI